MEGEDGHEGVRVAVADLPDDMQGVVGLLHSASVFDLLAARTLAVLPDPSLWRLTISGDFETTINRLDGRSGERKYTVQRGAGRAGARTSLAPDGVYDIVIDLYSFLTSESDDPDEILVHAGAAAAHLGTHEAGHALLGLRGESADHYCDSAGGGPSERAWRKHLANHLDDFRIERMTRVVAPNPTSQVPGLGDAIAHVRTELNASKGAIDADISAASLCAHEAFNYLLRVIAYTTAELGVAGGVGVRPVPTPPGWGRYLENSWDAWSLCFHTAKRADEPMSAGELAHALTLLCKLVIPWCDSLGFQWRMNDDGATWAYWTAERY